MLYYVEATHELDSHTFWDDYLIDVKNETEIRGVLEGVLNRYYTIHPASVAIRSVHPFDKIDSLTQYRASRNIIYRDINFNSWKLRHSDYPNKEITDIMKYKKINIYFVSKTKEQEISLNVNFIIMSLMVSKDKINIMPFLSKTDNNDIAIYDIIQAAPKDILSIFVFPKNSNLSSVITSLSMTKDKKNFMFFISDNSNQLYRIVSDHDTFVFRKV